MRDSLMEEFNSDPPLMLYVVWHPNFTQGENVGNFCMLLDRFGSYRYSYVSGGDHVRVMFRNAISSGAQEPPPIKWGDSSTTAVVVLLDNTLIQDHTWLDYVRNLSKHTEMSASAPTLSR